MKRSEMQSLIANMLRLYRFDNVEDMEASDRLLLVLEQAGMLPPETDAVEADFFTQGLSMEFLKNHDFKVNRWEPEDET